MAQRTISSAVVSGLSRVNSFPLMGVLEEGVHSVRHRVAGGLIARHRQQDHEERELDVVERFTGPSFPSFHVGLYQPRHDVVGRTAAALLGHGVGVTHQLRVGGGRVGVEVGVVGVHDRVGPVKQLVSIGLGHPDQVGDRQQRQVHRDIVDEVPAALLLCGGDDLARSGAEAFLERGDRPWCEQARHQLPQPGVLRCVVVDQQRLGEIELFGSDPVG